MRKASKNPVTVVRNKAVTLAKKITRFLGKYTCEYCGQSEPAVQTHGSHVYEEGTYRAMAADLDNIIVLCFTHHLGSWNAKQPSWHGSPMEMADWFREKYPARYEALKKRSRESIHADTYFWEAKLKGLQEKAKEIGL